MKEMNLGQKNIKTIMLAAVMLLCSVVFAQYSGLEDFEKTKLFYNNFSANKSDLSNLDSAKKYIEKAFIDDVIKRTDLLIIYRELFTKRFIRREKFRIIKVLCEKQHLCVFYNL